MSTSQPQPQAQDAPTTRVRYERRHRPTAAGMFHILVQLTAPVARATRERPPLDLAFVVDRSGSMAGGRLELAKRGVEHALRLLDERDRVTLVAYDDQLDTLLTLRAADERSRAKAQRRLRRVQPRGSTDLCGGWLTGCQQLAGGADAARPGALTRALLLTDGLANVGVTAPDALAQHARELRLRGISTSTFGVGEQFDEVLLAGMADAGGGRYHYIADAAAIPAVFAGELGELLQVVLRDVTLTLTWPAAWRVNLLNDLPCEREPFGVTLRLGELASSEQKALLWEADLPPVADGAEASFELTLRWRAADDDATRELTTRHTLQAREQPGDLDQSVQDELAGVIGARARAEAVAYNRAGDYARAYATIQQASAAMPRTAAGAAEAQELASLAPRMAAPTSAADLKTQHALARNRQRGQRDYSKPSA